MPVEPPAPAATAEEASEAPAVARVAAQTQTQARPRLADLRVEPLTAETLRIRGTFAGAEHPASLTLLDGVAPCGSANVDGEGRFEVTAPWRPGAFLTVALPGSITPLPFAATPPRLNETEAGVVVQGRPGGDVLLVQWSQPPRDGRAGRVLHAWWTRLDSQGALALRADGFAGASPAHLQAFTADRLSSNVLELRPRP
jgi:hypothetical protein